MSILIKGISKDCFNDILTLARYGANNAMVGHGLEVVEMSDRGILIEDPEAYIKELNEALRLLLDCVAECDFGYDNFPEEYERYKDEIEGMSYIEGMIHIAKQIVMERSEDGKNR